MPDELSLLRQLVAIPSVSGEEATLAAFVEAGHGPMIEECMAGTIFDREAYECASAAAAGSEASHECIRDSHVRG